MVWLGVVFRLAVALVPIIATTSEVDEHRKRVDAASPAGARPVVRWRVGASNPPALSLGVGAHGEVKRIERATLSEQPERSSESLTVGVDGEVKSVVRRVGTEAEAIHTTQKLQKPDVHQVRDTDRAKTTVSLLADKTKISALSTQLKSVDAHTAVATNAISSMLLWCLCGLIFVFVGIAARELLISRVPRSWTGIFVQGGRQHTSHQRLQSVLNILDSIEGERSRVMHDAVARHIDEKLVVDFDAVSLRQFLVKGGFDPDDANTISSDDYLHMLLEEVTEGKSCFVRVQQTDIEADVDSDDIDRKRKNANNRKSLAYGAESFFGQELLVLSPGLHRIVRLLRFNVTAKTVRGDLTLIEKSRSRRASVSSEARSQHRPLGIMISFDSVDLKREVVSALQTQLGLDMEWSNQFLNVSIATCNQLELQASRHFAGLPTCYLTTTVDVTIACALCPSKDIARIGLPSGRDFETSEPNLEFTHIWHWRAATAPNINVQTAPEKSPRPAEPSASKTSVGRPRLLVDALQANALHNERPPL